MSICVSFTVVQQKELPAKSAVFSAGVISLLLLVNTNPPKASFIPKWDFVGNSNSTTLPSNPLDISFVDGNATSIDILKRIADALGKRLIVDFIDIDIQEEDWYGIIYS